MTCSVEDCENQTHAKGLCHRHYTDRRKRRNAAEVQREREAQARAYEEMFEVPQTTNEPWPVRRTDLRLSHATARCTACNKSWPTPGAEAADVARRHVAKTGHRVTVAADRVVIVYDIDL